VRRACRRPQARTGPASHAEAVDGRRLPGDALIELDLRCRLGVGIEATRPGIGQDPRRRVAAGAVTAARSGELGASTPT
jgi:hypothetical protein